ncbi:MAG TPA: RDD family protein, partial [Thermodesulfatator atlanticus]|nr:RDD family protein [Thermodesulfatator atlanticus]
GKIISALLLGVGFLMVAFTRKKQGLHDIMARCLVVNK